MGGVGQGEVAAALQAGPCGSESREQSLKG